MVIAASNAVLGMDGIWGANYRLPEGLGTEYVPVSCFVKNKKKYHYY
ncbi:MAG: hypothetical protein ACLU6Y_14955 [Ruminococcus sp.]